MRRFADNYHRQMVAGFAGDIAPADPMAAGTTWQPTLARPDKPEAVARTFQAYYRTNAVITCTFKLWLHGDGTDWIAPISIAAALAGVNQLEGFEYAGKLDDALIHLQVTPTAPLGAGETIDLYAEPVEFIEEIGTPATGLRLVP